MKRGPKFFRLTPVADPFAVVRGTTPMKRGPKA